MNKDKNTIENNICHCTLIQFSPEHVMLIILYIFTTVETLISAPLHSVPSKIFTSRLVSKKCRQDQKKLRRPWKIFLKCVHFQRKYFSSTIVGEWPKKCKMVFAFSNTYTHKIFWCTNKKSHHKGNKWN